MIGGKFLGETRMTMGHRVNPQTAQWLSSVIARFVLEAFDEEFPRVPRGVSTSIQKVIAGWVRRRAVGFGDVKDQTRPMMVAVLQDDYGSCNFRRSCRLVGRMGSGKVDGRAGDQTLAEGDGVEAVCGGIFGYRGDIRLEDRIDDGDADQAGCLKAQTDGDSLESGRDSALGCRRRVEVD